MGTINKKIADDIIAGKYPTDGVVKIVTYNNMFNGGITFAYVFAHEDINKYEKSPACRDVRVYWEKPLPTSEQQHKATEYLAIRWWLNNLFATEETIQARQQHAAETNAPIDAIYYVKTRKSGWLTMESLDIANQEAFNNWKIRNGYK